MRRIFLIDCPGVVYPSEDSESDIVLKGVVSTFSSRPLNLPRKSCCHSNKRKVDQILPLRPLWSHKNIIITLLLIQFCLVSERLVRLYINLLARIVLIWFLFSASRFKWRRSETQRSTLAPCWSEQSQSTFRRPTTSRLGAQRKTFLRSWRSVRENFWRFGSFSCSPELINFFTQLRAAMNTDTELNVAISVTAHFCELKAFGSLIQQAFCQSKKWTSAHRIMFWTASFSSWLFC